MRGSSVGHHVAGHSAVISVTAARVAFSSRWPSCYAESNGTAADLASSHPRFSDGPPRGCAAVGGDVEVPGRWGRLDEMTHVPPVCSVTAGHRVRAAVVLLAILAVTAVAIGGPSDAALSRRSALRAESSRPVGAERTVHLFEAEDPALAGECRPRPARPHGPIYRENVGRTLVDGTPISRELSALDDLEGATEVRPGFTAYDR